MQIGIELCKRHYGQHNFVKGIMIDVDDVEELVVATAKRIGAGINLDYLVDEDLILTEIPKKWLPVEPEHILLLVGDENGGTAVSSPRHFRSWAKYFDAYSLTVSIPSNILKKIDDKARKSVVADEKDRKVRMSAARKVTSKGYENEPTKEAYEFVWTYWEHGLSYQNNSMAYLNGQILRDLEIRGYPQYPEATKAALDEIKRRRKEALKKTA